MQIITLNHITDSHFFFFHSSTELAIHSDICSASHDVLSELQTAGHVAGSEALVERGCANVADSKDNAVGHLSQEKMCSAWVLTISMY